MKLGRYTVGYVVSAGVAAVIFILVVKYAGKKWPNAPILGAVARTV